nr:hypothetical protein [Mycoplasmopsis bovis]
MNQKRPSKLWVYNRMINNTDFYNYNKTNKPNELFIHNEFLYGRKLDPKKVLFRNWCSNVNNLT